MADRSVTVMVHDAELVDLDWKPAFTVPVTLTVSVAETRTLTALAGTVT